MPSLMKKPLRPWALSEKEKSMWRPLAKGLLLNGVESGAGVSQDESTNENERMLLAEGASSGEEGLGPETCDGCESDEIRDTDVKIVEHFEARNVVRGKVWSDVLEGMVPEK